MNIDVETSSGRQVWNNLRWGLAGLALVAAACGTTSNRTVRDGGSVPSRAPSVARAARGENGGTESTQPAGSAASGATSPSAPTSPRAAIDSPTGNMGSTIARVAEQDVPASELLELWLFRESPKVRAYLEEMILSRLVLAEAHRLEMSLEVALLDRAFDVALAGLRQQIQKNAPQLSVEDFVRQRLGLDPELYKQRLRRETEIDLLAERCVRAWLMQSDRAEVRVIVVEDRDVVDEVQAKIEAGEDFAQLAADYSIEDSANEGGRVPPIVRSDAALSRLAFTTPLGAVGGPVLEQGRFLFLKVEDRRTPLAGTWDRLRSLVEASLAERAIEDPEYWQWKMAMLERYPVDMTPFLELVGEPADGPGEGGAAGALGSLGEGSNP